MMKDTPFDKGKEYRASRFRSAGERSRRSGGRLIGAFVSELTRPAFRHKSPLFMRLVMDWENLVGKHLAQQSAPRRLRPGVLSVGCSGPVAMEMHYAAPQILERINTACGLFGEYRLRELKLTQDVTMTPLPCISRPPSCPVAVPDMEEGPLRDVLERLGGHIAACRSRRGRSF